MNEPTEVILVRHGETEWNREGRMQGHLDSSLTAAGREQARLLASRIARMAPAAIYTSDLGRALQTAQAIATGSGLVPVADSGLRERHLGIFQGLRLSQVSKRYAEVWQDYKRGGPDFVIPEGESARQRHERNLTALRFRAEQHAGERIVVVGHSGLLNTVFRVCTAMTLEVERACRMDNASMNVVAFDGHGWELVTWNDLAHLDQV